jgi:predicted RNA binding protein YcfA (HicA-like mRNA interferase family)
MDSRRIVRMILKAGWVHVSTRGDHHKFRDPASGRHIVVPHPVKDLTIGVLRSIERATGIKFH